MGHIGMHGTRLANKVILEADVILAIGTRFQDRSTGTLDDFCPEAKIIHIDIDAAEIGKNVDVDVPIVADAKVTALTRMHGAADNAGTESSRSSAQSCGSRFWKLAFSQARVRSVMVLPPIYVLTTWANFPSRLWATVSTAPFFISSSAGRT